MRCCREGTVARGGLFLKVLSRWTLLKVAHRGFSYVKIARNRNVLMETVKIQHT